MDEAQKILDRMRKLTVAPCFYCSNPAENVEQRFYLCDGCPKALKIDSNWADRPCPYCPHGGSMIKVHICDNCKTK